MGKTEASAVKKGATKHCAYGTCSSDSRYPDRQSMCNVFFIRFPQRHRELEKCRRWVKACSRLAFDERRVTKDTYICSIHFVGGKGPTSDHPDPLPATATKYDVQKLEKKPRRRIQRRLISDGNAQQLQSDKKDICVHDESSNDVTKIPLSHQIQNSEKLDGKENDAADRHPAKRSRMILEENYDLEEMQQQNNVVDVGCQTEQPTAASDHVAVRLQNKLLEKENKLLKAKVEFLESANTKLTSTPSKDHPEMDGKDSVNFDIYQVANETPSFINHDHSYMDHSYMDLMTDTIDKGKPISTEAIGVQTDLCCLDLKHMPDRELKDINVLQRRLTMDSVLKDESSCKFYTGLSLAVLSFILQLISPAAETLKYWRSSDTGNSEQKQRHASRILSVKEELVLTLLRCRRGIDVQMLGDLFAISSTTVSRIFTTWITFLYHHLQFMIQWPSKEQVRLKLPKCFKYFPNTRVGIDCTEFYVQKPSLPSAQRITWSNYKHQNTFKLLVGISPSGTITFLSKLFTGSISDKKIVEQSGFLDKLEYGDDVMADRGFLIRDLVTMKHATLNIPPFAMGKQLSHNAVTKTRRIASARIHVEGAIGRLKSFHILQGVIPMNLRPVLDQIVFVCSALCNLDLKLVK